MEKHLTAKQSLRQATEKKIAELDRTFAELRTDYNTKRDTLVAEIYKLDGAIEMLKELLNGQGKEGKSN